MKSATFLFIVCLAIPFIAKAGSRSSASYSVTADTVDAGGRRSAVANYTNEASLGSIGTSISTSANYAVKPGYEGQVFQVTSFILSATPTNVNETATRQLVGTATLDDNSVLPVPGSFVSWSVLGGPIATINTNGLATAAAVYQNTPATVRGDYQQKFSSIGLLVLNVNPDNFGLYAGDGLPDDWQVGYFGESNPSGAASADPDADGQTNAYEYVVGTVPTNSASRFALTIQPATVPTQKSLAFSPRFTNRTYAVQFRTNLNTGGFLPLTTFTQTDNGTLRTVTDTNGIEVRKFYRVQITLP